MAVANVLPRVAVGDAGAGGVHTPNVVDLGDVVAAGSRDVLGIEDVHVRFGGVAALAGATFDVAEHAITGVIGPNGAGKTTLFNCINGLVPVDAGAIRYRGSRLDRLPAHRIAHAGVSRTFQNLGLYPRMTVRENMVLGGLPLAASSFWAVVRRASQVRRDFELLNDLATDLLRRVGASHLHHVRVGDLPFGTMKRVELARALMPRPSLLLLDEPAGGLSHGEVDEFAALIRQLRDEFRLTIVLIEHHMGMVMGLCERIAVLHLGRTLAEGTPDVIRKDPRVIAAYLGTPG
ncbi:ABC transporter ATP-binding protein [Bradyrhizobium sp. U87765 SZCCT0131]|uniref:ABC transporter ATP-binding protein n=1 Tax=unclassified Bradyrhizobium TaxID=2631580 RepID=UPI001BABB99B|nr:MULTISPECIES: ABC transporter ATP-binding protein [unclassified Bradyrhizobium]MBR1218565.1 ABC transporter ATP-binding protein [Bradyrhizobium sp. U87765 SZCCT0131]MBR1260489.1 ABC transporter ATP-binding protein [Bradyrhizobium sp. U87765 SZCCT0134]MBR1304063.1 ABC transporter ATP-binding protein [Bradyrhizobium sp. U87765 SZCCT0110]MBR1319669.1 ABC transporter ATP-binding protein [Bradyrhizobium sp. U87765 SZCCT0109]MBR1347994.1 ABC transporter ATP-binding protein [Bradyrhizobium sp. U87